MSYKISLASVEDSTVQYLNRSTTVRCRTPPNTDRIRLHRLIIRHLRRLMTVRYRSHTVLLSASVFKIIQFIVWSPLLAGFCELNYKFNLIVVETLKPVFCFSCDSVPLKVLLNQKTKLYLQNRESRKHAIGSQQVQWAQQVFSDIYTLSLLSWSRALTIIQTRIQTHHMKRQKYQIIHPYNV